MVKLAWEHPCRRCGACCASFRVSFYWAEAGTQPDQVPEALTLAISPHRAAMRGTERAGTPRCVALDGELGVSTTCTIHPVRPSTCRAFDASFEHGAHEARCDEARARHGLAPLTLNDWDVGERPEPPDSGPGWDHAV